MGDWKKFDGVWWYRDATPEAGGHVDPPGPQARDGRTMHNLCMGTDPSIDHLDAAERGCCNRPL